MTTFQKECYAKYEEALGVLFKEFGTKEWDNHYMYLRNKGKTHGEALAECRDRDQGNKMPHNVYRNMIP